MKVKVFAVILFAAIIGLASCGKDSNDNNIVSIKVNGVDYTPTGTEFTHNFPKTSENVWNTAMPTTWPSAVIEIKLANGKAKTNYAANGSINLTTGSIEVTAQNGDKKTYNLRFSRTDHL
jgi:cytoskeletal protein RodZ